MFENDCFIMSSYHFSPFYLIVKWYSLHFDANKVYDPFINIYSIDGKSRQGK